MQLTFDELLGLALHDQANGGQHANVQALTEEGSSLHTQLDKPAEDSNVVRGRPSREGLGSPGLQVTGRQQSQVLVYNLAPPGGLAEEVADNFVTLLTHLKELLLLR